MREEPTRREVRPDRLDPELVSERWEATRGEQELVVQTDLDCWPGHFPDFPVVPGVLQISWAVRAAERWLGPAPEFERIEALKFKNLLRPGQRLRLFLEWDESRGRLAFRLFEGDTVFSEGRLVLAAPATA